MARRRIRRCRISRLQPLAVSRLTDKLTKNFSPMDEIKIGIGVSSIGRFLSLLGKAAGFFEKENISVEVVNQQDEEKVVSDIVTQTTPVGTPNAPSLIFSLLEGNDLVIVGGILNRPAFYLAANAAIRGITGLTGNRWDPSGAAHGGYGDAGAIEKMEPGQERSDARGSWHQRPQHRGTKSQRDRCCAFAA